MEIRKVILFIIVSFYFYSFNLKAQTDTSFWFVAPWVTPNHEANYPLIFHITSFGQQSTVTISMPADASFTPIVISVPANQMINKDVTTLKNNIQNSPGDLILTKGLYITATSPVSIYYQIGQSENPEIFVLKGKNALGTNFVIPGQNKYSDDINNFYGATAKSSFDIVATENNTTVNITVSRATGSHAAGSTFTIHLNKGNSYSLIASSQTADGHLTGSVVTSDKPIAITIKDDSMDASNCQDLVGDQIVPVNVTGTNYVAIKGNFSPVGNEGVFVTSTQDATEITVNGTKVTTINKNMTYFVPMTNASMILYIQTSKPAYAFQLTGNGCEASGTVLPQLTCTGSRKIAFSRVTNEEFYLKLLAPKYIVNSFYYSINNGTRVHIDTTKNFFQVPGTELMYARILVNGTNIPANSQCVLENDMGIFQMGFQNLTGNGNGALQGYFSNFNVGNSGKKTITTTQYASCTAVLGVMPGAAYYHWYDENQKNIASYEGKDTVSFPITNLEKDIILMVVYPNDECGGIDSLTFNVKPVKPIAGFNETLCKTGSDSIKLSFDPEKCLIPTSTYHWIDSRYGDSTKTEHYIKQDGTYKVFFWDGKCLADSGVYKVSIVPEPSVNLTDPPKLCSDSSVTLDAGSHPGMSLKWVSDNPDMIQPDTNQKVYIKLPLSKQASDQHFIYTITVSNKCNVAKTASANINFTNCAITIPNVFTPNGDGINDYLYIDKVDNVNYLDWEVIIYNRWGRKVYETNRYINGDSNHSWNGAGATDGVYFYVVRNLKLNKTFTGFIQLIR